MTRNEMKRKLAEMVIKARTAEALELVQKKMEMLGFTDLVFEGTEEEAVVGTTPWEKGLKSVKTCEYEKETNEN